MTRHIGTPKDPHISGSEPGFAGPRLLTHPAIRPRKRRWAGGHAAHPPVRAGRMIRVRGRSPHSPPSADVRAHPSPS